MRQTKRCCESVLVYTFIYYGKFARSESAAMTKWAFNSCVSVPSLSIGVCCEPNAEGGEPPKLPLGVQFLGESRMT